MRIASGSSKRSSQHCVLVRVVSCCTHPKRRASATASDALRPDASAEPVSRATSWRFSADLHCAECDIHYQEPAPSLFSFNSPLGACDSCRGFGRTIGIDFGLIVPDESKTLRAGAVRPWQTQAYSECQDDLIRFARKRGVPLDTPWSELTQEHKRWVLEGEGSWEDKAWYGVRRFFAWLETKSYKMHIRVLLSKYRAYTPCAACAGARLKTDALLWRLGTRSDADALLRPGERFKPAGASWSAAALSELPGVSIHELMLAPIERCHAFFATLALPAPLDEASDLVLREMRSRLGFLLDVGLGYLTLDRQSRTLSGGEVQRINLTTALGTSLVNTLFVLDEPSIGLHPRDMGRVIEVMQRLRAAGNSLVVVEHDPQVMQAADRIIDVGPGPGERGGEIVFFGAPAGLSTAKRSLTADYLLGRRSVSSPSAESRVTSHESRPDRCSRIDRHSRRAPAQSQERECFHPAEATRMHHGRIGLRKVDTGSGRSASGFAQGLWQTDGDARCARRDRRRSSRERRRAGRSDSCRTYNSIQPGELCRRLRCNPQTVCSRAPRTRARLHRRDVQLQFRQGSMSRHARGTASSTSRCSFSRTCTCAARIAMGAGIVKRYWKSR